METASALQRNARFKFSKAGQPTAASPSESSLLGSILTAFWVLMDGQGKQTEPVDARRKTGETQPTRAEPRGHSLTRALKDALERVPCPASAPPQSRLCARS